MNPYRGITAGTLLGVAVATPLLINLGVLVVYPWASLRQESAAASWALLPALTSQLFMTYALVTVVLCLSFTVVGAKWIGARASWRLNGPFTAWRISKVAAVTFVTSFSISLIAPSLLTIPVDRLATEMGERPAELLYFAEYWVPLARCIAALAIVMISVDLVVLAVTRRSRSKQEILLEQVQSSE